MWYFSFSCLINLQKCQQFCVFLSIWGAVCTLMRKKNEQMILANGCNITKSETFKGVWILSVPTVILVIGTSRLSLSSTHGLKSPNSYEIAYDKYIESLSCPHPPMYNNIVYRRSHRLAIWLNYHIAQHYSGPYWFHLLNFLSLLKNYVCIDSSIKWILFWQIVVIYRCQKK